MYLLSCSAAQPLTRDPSGAVWLCAAPRLLMGSLCPSVFSYSLVLLFSAQTPVLLSGVHGRNGPMPCAVQKTLVPGMAQRGDSCVARRCAVLSMLPPYMTKSFFLPKPLCCCHRCSLLTQSTPTFITTAVIFPFTATCCHAIGCHAGSPERSRLLAISKLIWGFL